MKLLLLILVLTVGPMLWLSIACALAQAEQDKAAPRPLGAKRKSGAQARQKENYLIDYPALCEAARNADASAEVLGLPQYIESKGIRVKDLQRAAEQRALRVAALLVDGNAEVLDASKMKPIKLSQKAEALMPLFMAAWMDGFVMGTTAKE